MKKVILLPRTFRTTEALTAWLQKQGSKVASLDHHSVDEFYEDIYKRWRGLIVEHEARITKTDPLTNKPVYNSTGGTIIVKEEPVIGQFWLSWFVPVGPEGIVQDQAVLVEAL